jgi:hypothetical protein
VNLTLVGPKQETGKRGNEKGNRTAMHTAPYAPSEARTGQGISFISVITFFSTLKMKV